MEHHFIQSLLRLRADQITDHDQALQLIVLIGHVQIGNVLGLFAGRQPGQRIAHQLLRTHDAGDRLQYFADGAGHRDRQGRRGFVVGLILHFLHVLGDHRGLRRGQLGQHFAHQAGIQRRQKGGRVQRYASPHFSNQVGNFALGFGHINTRYAGTRLAPDGGHSIGHTGCRLP